METQTLRLGHSPDPDDAFMFYGLAKDLLPSGKWRFEHVLQDIQTLNQRAMQGELEITAISIHAYPYVAHKYALTSCGSSMGDKYGPMIVTRQPMGIDDLRGKTIAIPGEMTTAFLTLQLLLGKGSKGKLDDAGAAAGMAAAPADLPNRAHNPEASPAFYYEVVHFDQIPAYVRDGKADAGLLIHEGQLTFANEGLHLVVDLGSWWHDKTGLPLPLGGNCIRRDLGQEAMQEVTNILKKSIQYSLDHRAEAVEYALQFGRDLNRELADKFVGMYVNDWTLDYGPRGRAAITRLLSEGAKAGIVPDVGEIDYVMAR
ncbi:MAG TPA: MqnA/MqnD/SBP family protein [Tepidisphaeraceae bacterium]|jgi:1,4-dihydroxy-6-naphthoate synthase|nr:MqnA/MqnD/SBP family protein [Tepidisphaeraceae bacterium]